MTPEKLSALIAKVATATRARLLADQAAQDAQGAYSEALTLIPKPPAPAPVPAPAAAPAPASAGVVQD